MRCVWKRALSLLSLPAALGRPPRRAASNGDRRRNEGSDPDGDITRLQYSRQVEDAVNHQINAELRASYTYLAMASFFALPTVALRGLETHCWSMCRRERRDALRLVAYQTTRGARVCLSAVESPEPCPASACNASLRALAVSLEVQRGLAESLLRIHELAESTGDPVTGDFIRTSMLCKQVRRVEAAARYLTLCQRLGETPQGAHDFDEWLLGLHKSRTVINATPGADFITKDKPSL